MKSFIALLFLALAPAWVYGQEIEIKPENRVKNQTGVQCMWSSAETLARHQGYTQLYNLTKNYKAQASCQTVMQVMLQAGGVDFVFVRGPGLTSIEEAIQAGNPIAVIITSGPTTQHCYIASGLDKKAGTITIIDNVGDMKPRQYRIDDFMRIYLGECFYLKKKK